MNGRVLATILLQGLVTGTAWGQACPEPYDRDNLSSDLQHAEDALRAGDEEGAATQAAALKAGLPCLHEVFPSMMLGRVYRAIGGGMFADGDHNGAARWFRTSVSLDELFSYGLEDLPQGDPIISAYEQARRTLDEPVRVEGMALIEGDHYLDGLPLSSPRARPAQYHLYQFKGADGRVQSWIIDGEAFPEGQLRDPNAVAAEPERGRKKDRSNDSFQASSTTPKPSRTRGSGVEVEGASIVVQRPPEKIPLIIAGSAVVLGSGAMYYVSSLTRKNFQNAENEEDARAAMRTTNSLVIASGVVFALGAGTLGWGIAVSGDAPVPTFNLRF